MSSPQISVIIPVFNHAKELEACLASLKKQTLQDFEVFVIDDGSSVPVKDASVRFEKNRGAPTARNEGFRRSSAPFVIFLDADAVLVPDALEMMQRMLIEHPDADFVYASFKYGLKLFKARPFDEQALREGNYIHTSALIRREAFPGFDESLKKFQDWDLFLTMSERGSKGVWIDRVLFTIKPHGTMSAWLPRFTYQLPWPIFGWTPKAIKKYNEARAIIAKKHGLPAEPDTSNAILWLGLIALVEALSVIAAFNPTLSTACLIIAGLSMLVVSVFRPDIGFTALVLEFFIGSFGRMFAIGGEGGVPLRMILFASFFLGWGLHSLKVKPSFRSVHIPWPYFILATSVVLGMVLGRHNSLSVLRDANAWFAFLLLIPALDLASCVTARQKAAFMDAVRVGVFWLCAKTITLFYFFSHDFGAFWQSLYLWVRRTGVGEITIISPTASVARVFIQSQIYPALATLYVMTRKGRESFSFLVLCVTTVLISFSRSFWIGLMVGLFFLMLALLRRKMSGNPFPRLLASGLVSVIIISGLFYFPVPSSHGNLMDVFLSRADSSESAAASRWELLPLLNAKIAEAPLFGHGFGETVTYQSKDPRIVAKTGGVYTTYAFEWGWHDFAVKLGFVGVIAYALVLVSLFHRLGKAGEPIGQAMLAMLAAVHVFTPYLNHPLGIMVLILLEVRLVSKMKSI